MIALTCEVIECRQICVTKFFLTYYPLQFNVTANTPPPPPAPSIAPVIELPQQPLLPQVPLPQQMETTPAVAAASTQKFVVTAKRTQVEAQPVALPTVPQPPEEASSGEAADFVSQLVSEAPPPSAAVKKEEEPPQLQVDPMSAWQSSFVKAATGTTAVAAGTAPPPVVPAAVAAPIPPIVQEMKVEPKVEETAVATASTADAADRPVSPTPTTSSTVSPIKVASGEVMSTAKIPPIMVKQPGTLDFDPFKETKTVTNSAGDKFEIPAVVESGYDLDKMTCTICDKTFKVSY